MKAQLDLLRARLSSAPPYAYVLGLIVLVGLFLRTLGYFDGSNGLWNDEANWVLRMSHGQSGGNIRPPGYVLLNRLLIAWRPSEAVLRSSSYLAGLASLPLFVSVARRAGFTRWPTALGLFVLAVHPWAIAYAKEWKPYGFELGLHFAVLAMALRYLEKRTLRELLLLALVCGAALPFGWNLVFLFPGIVLCVWIVQYQTRAFRQLYISGGAALAGAAAVLILHFHRLERLFSGRRGSDVFWGNKYGVFYLVRGDVFGKLRWELGRTWELLGFPGQLKAFWDSSGGLSAAFAFAFATLALTGVVVLLFERNWRLLLLFVTPWLFTLLANWIGLWPYGVFRTNVYLLAYALPLGLVPFVTLGKWLDRRDGAWPKRLAPLALGALVLAFLPYDLHYFRYKDPATNAYSSLLGPSLARIREYETKARGPRAELVLDGYACGTAQYYLTLHPDYKSMGPWFSRRVRRQCVDNSMTRLERTVKRIGKKPLWVITARPLTAEPARRFLTRYCARLDVAPQLPTPDTLFHCVPR